MFLCSSEMSAFCRSEVGNILTSEWSIMSCVGFADQQRTRLQGERKKESLLKSMGCSSKMRLITAKTEGECFCFKNKYCERDCLQNGTDINLFCF